MYRPIYENTRCFQKLVSTAHKLLTLLSCLLADSLCNSSACGGSLRRDFVGLALALGADGVLMRVTPEPFEPSLHSPRLRFLSTV